MRETQKEIRQRYIQMLAESRPRFLEKGYSITEFAADLGTNRSYASRFVNNELKITFPNLLIRLRLAHFLRLKNENPQALIKTLVAECGFSSPFSFRRAFAKTYGATPTEYFKNREGE